MRLVDYSENLIVSFLLICGTFGIRFMCVALMVIEICHQKSRQVNVNVTEQIFFIYLVFFFITSERSERSSY